MSNRSDESSELRPSRFAEHVSRTINVSYLRPAPSGTVVRLRCQVMALGKQMCMVRGELRSKDGKKIYCTMEHHKVRVQKSQDAARALDMMREEWMQKAEKSIRAML